MSDPQITEEMIEAALAGADLLSNRVSRDQMRIALAAALAGRTVLDLPEPTARHDRLDGFMDVWPIGGWSVTRSSESISICFQKHGVGGGVGFSSPERARAFAAALLAAADRTERLAAVSSKGGEPRE